MNKFDILQFKAMQMFSCPEKHQEISKHGWRFFQNGSQPSRRIIFQLQITLAFKL